MADLFAEVALNLGVARTFTYRVPGPLREAVKPGVRVRVPFAHRDAKGYCVGLSDSCGIPRARVLEIAEVLDAEPLLSPKMLELAKWIGEYYCCGWGQALQAAVLAGVRRGTQDSYFSKPLEACPCAVASASPLRYPADSPQPGNRDAQLHRTGRRRGRPAAL